MKYFFLSFFALCVLVVGVFGVRGQKFSRPPIEIFPDMDRQDVVKGQQPSQFFHDGMGARLPVAGTVPMHGDDGLFPVEFGEGRTGYYYTGAINDHFAHGTPEKLGLTEDNVGAFLRRGQERYEIFCAVCHGEKGDGKGVTSKYGVPNIANFVEDPRFAPDQYPDGKIYHVITHGWNLMGSYGANIPVRDRWAIVAYVRALQAVGKGDAAPAPVDETPEPETASN